MSMSMKKSTLKRLISFIRPHTDLVVLSSIFAVLNVGLTLLTPILIGQAIDCIGFTSEESGLISVDFERIPYLTATLAVTFILASFFSWLMNQCVNRLSYRVSADLRNESFSKIRSAPLSYIDSNSQGDLVSRVIGDIDIISDGLLQGAAQLLTGVASIIGTMAFMLSQSVIIGVVVIVLTPLSVFAASFISKRIHSAFKEQSEITGELGGYADEMISNRKLTAAFAYEHEADKKFYEINKRLKVCGQKAQFYSSLTNPVTRFVNGLVYAAAGITGALLAVSSGTVSPGQISSFLAYANQYTKPFNEISGVIAQLQSAIASAARVFSVIDVIAETHGEPENEKTPDKVIGVVSAEHVSFSYVSEKPLIRDLNIDIKSGSRVAIVGPTGCGKTTFINLLMRFYDVTGGKISVDGVDIKDMKRSSLRAMYGMVLQDTWLFDGTIRENIAYSRPDASDEEIESAAKDANIHSFIRRLPDGYDTVISGDESSQISAGQKQLLCIARVMLAKTPMLILDEATSSIDTMTEVRISRAFDTMMKGHTSFIVAHRLSTIKNADLILVMRDGDIVETGSHTELLEKHGDYANLWNRQFSE